MPRAAGESGALARYQRKRDFSLTPEPVGEVGGQCLKLGFVVQKHAARSLHYDFRLELDGTLKSWAVPKGPSLDPKLKRMAVEVEDHPLSYAGFEGVIPPNQYGAGTVVVWDRGRWVPVGDPRAGLRDGKLKFRLEGVKLRGQWRLVRLRPRGEEKQPSWLLIKEDDDFARPSDRFDVLEAAPDSVLEPPPPALRKPRARPRAQTAPQAVRASLPERVSPQLATLVDEGPEGDDWQYEIKFDGYRLLTRIVGADVRCFTRNGHDWSDRLPRLVDACRALGARSAWLDGEIVVHGGSGAPDFQALQNALESKRSAPIVYFVFDLLFGDGFDLRELPLVQRRERLARLLGPHPDGPVRLSAALDADPRQLLQSAARAGLEGLVGKRKSSRYSGTRSGDWIKLKTRQRQEFVVGGYTDPKGSRQGLGSLLLGLQGEDGRLHYAGNVGSGFDETSLAELAQRLQALQRTKSPFADPPARVGTVNKAAPHWVKPELVAEVSFAEWTRQQRVRHAVFHGLRSDKSAKEVVRELPAATAGHRPGLRVTHGERVVDRASGLSKSALLDYYVRVAPLMLPHLESRPVALLRAPRGVGGPAFFQKHAEAGVLPHVERLDPDLDPGHEPLMAIASLDALLSVAQLNTIELHTWNATARAIARPDRMVFDLDPGEGVAWAQVREAALLVRGALDELGLAGFLKTSGGKGLHVVVPLQPRLGWTAVKGFSQVIVAHMAQVLPQRFVAKSGPSNRVGRIFIDYLRNGFGATTVAAWSARARPGLGISVPVGWDEIDRLSGGAHWTVAGLAGRDAVGNQPWRDYEDSRRSLAPAMKKLGYKAPRDR